MTFRAPVSSESTCALAQGRSRAPAGRAEVAVGGASGAVFDTGRDANADRFG